MTVQQRLPNSDRRAVALAALGAFYLRQGAPQTAAPLLRAALRLADMLRLEPTARRSVESPSDVDWIAATLRRLAYAEILLGRGPEAERLLDDARLAPRTPDDAEALSHLRARARLCAGRETPRAAVEPAARPTPPIGAAFAQLDDALETDAAPGRRDGALW